MLILLKQEDKRAADLSSLLAHDLNNGLGVIAGYCEIMAEDVDPDSEFARQLHLILKVVRGLAERVNGQECRLVGRATTKC